MYPIFWMESIYPLSIILWISIYVSYFLDGIHISAFSQFNYFRQWMQTASISICIIYLRWGTLAPTVVSRKICTLNPQSDTKFVSKIPLKAQKKFFVMILYDYYVLPPHPQHHPFHPQTLHPHHHHQLLLYPCIVTMFYFLFFNF